MSKEEWEDVYQRKMEEAEERGLKHPEDWAAEEATEELVSRADFLADWLKDERTLRNP